MRLPPFEYQAPSTLDEALKIKRDQGASAQILAGGTDLIVNLKHRLFSPATVVSLNNITEIKQIELRPDALVLGAGASLASVASHPAVNEHFPILVKAINSIGALGIQHFRGTIGGNLLLQPRCIFYNQSHYWRMGKGLCHRTGGKDCLALEGSDSCHSICSGDTVPVLMALSAQLTLAGSGGKRVAPLAEFFTGKGESPWNIMQEEILTEIRIPLPWAPLSWSYQRLAMRAAVDFPLVNAATVAVVENGKVEHFRLVLSSLGPAPIVLREVEAQVKGAAPSRKMLNPVQDAAVRVAEGVVVANASTSKEYRVGMAGILARRATAEALGLD
jgi:4-hydroxybenzoyl-CoA reductase subunit beta